MPIQCEPILQNYQKTGECWPWMHTHIRQIWESSSNIKYHHDMWSFGIRLLHALSILAMTSMVNIFCTLSFRLSIAKGHAIRNAVHQICMFILGGLILILLPRTLWSSELFQIPCAAFLEHLLLSIVFKPE